MKDMSYITNTILTFHRKDELLILEVDKFEFETEGTGFAPPPIDNWTGGFRLLERPVMIAAFNHLDEGGLMAHMSTLDWTYPICVQLMFASQDDDRFRIWEMDKERNWHQLSP